MNFRFQRFYPSHQCIYQNLYKFVGRFRNDVNKGNPATDVQETFKYLKPKFHVNNIYKFNSYVTKTHCIISITKSNLLTLFREITGIYSENHTKQTM
jgi:hypothetical protein